MSTASGAVPANDLPDDLVPAGDLPDNVNATAAAPSGPPGPISQGVEALRQSPVGAAAEGTAGGLWNLVVKAGSGYAGALGAALPGPAGQGAAWQQGVENAASYQPQNRVLNSAMQKGEQLAETPSPLTRAVDTYSAAHPAAGAAIGAASQGVIQTAPLALGLAGAPEAAAAEEIAAAPRTPPKTTPGPITAAELKAAPERLPPVTKPESTPPAGGATPVGTSPTTAPPAAAPEPAPVRFTAPEATGTQHGALPAAEQASRAQALDQLHEDSGGQLPERRASAITGDYSETGTDYQHAQMPGPAGDRMKGQIAAENGALKVASENTVDATGGVAHGVDQPALAERGATIDRALQGVSDWFDNNVKTLYKAADAQAGGMPIQKFTNTQQLLSDPTQFAGTVEGEALHRGAVARAQSLGLVGKDGAWNPATVQQAENFRSWIGDQYTPRTARMLYKMKDAVDNDVATHGGAAVYQASRALRAKQSQMLEGPTGISKLLDADNTGVNRAVPIERVADHVTNLPRDQFNHVVNVLHDSSKLGNGELAEGNAAALNEIRGHMAARLHEAGASARDGSWDPYKYHQTLDKYSLKMPSVFSPEGMQRYKTINDAGNALRMDKRYPGAAAQIAKTGGLRALAAPRIAGAVEGLATGWLGPARGLAVEATGIAPAIRSGIERVVGGDTAAKNLKAINSRILPAGKTPLGAKIGGGSQRGAVGNLGRRPYEAAPPQKDVWGGVRAMNDRMPQREQRTGNPYETGGGQTMGARVFGGKQRGAVGDLSQRDAVEHGAAPRDDGTVLHRYTIPGKGGGISAMEYPELGVTKGQIAAVTDKGKGWGTRALQRAVDDAHGRGQVWHSDENVSEGQAGAYKNLAQLGYKVTKKDSDLRGGAYHAVGDHVFEVRPPAPSAYEKSGDLRDLCPKMAGVQPYNAAQLANKFPGQRGGPKFVPEKPATLNVGHNVGDPAAGGRVLGKDDVARAVATVGGKIQSHDVIQPGENSPNLSEPTSVVGLKAPLSEKQGVALANQLGQKAVAQSTGPGEGSMFVPKQHAAEAASQGWDKFNGDYFHHADGRTETQHATEFNPEELEKQAHPGSTVKNPQRSAYPGIYDDPKEIMSRVKTAPEDPIMKSLFGVSRKDLHDVALSRGDVAPKSIPGVKEGAGPTVSGDEVIRHVQRNQVTSAPFKEQYARELVGLDAGGDYKKIDYPLDQIHADQPVGHGLIKRYADRSSPFPAIVMDSDGNIRDGNHRIAAARARGDTTIPAYVPIDTTTGRMAAAAKPKGFIETRGSAAAKNVMTPENADRIKNTISAFKAHDEPAYHGMAGWYVMDPLHKAVEGVLGKGKAADAAYSRLNAMMGMASPGSDVGTEITRGTAAHMMASQGKFDKFERYGGQAENARGKNFPPEMENVPGHPYHGTAQTPAMRRLIDTGAGAQAPKTSMYIASSERGGSPEFQNKVLVGDSHFSRGAGLSDVRTAKDTSGSISGPELADLHPWYHENVAKPLGLPATSAQAVQWGALSHETGVETPVGAPKLELFAQQVKKAAERMGVSPKVALTRIIKGIAHAG